MEDSQTDSKLTMRQLGALVALISEPTIRKAAIAADVPETTLYHWLKDPDFDTEYRVMRRDATQQAIAVIQKFSSTAAAKLCQLAVRSKSEAIQFAASKAVLEYAIKSVELEDIVARIEALERAHAERS
jgi:hypothetical protein